MLAMYRIGFIVEQVLGHVTHGQNLRANVADDVTIEAFWGLPAWQSSRIPLYKSNWTVQAGMQTRKLVAGMQRQAPLDALFFHTQVTAVLATNWVKKIPSIISLDATPKQYDELGEYYAHGSGPAWLEQVKWKLNRNAFHAAKHIVTWSDWAKQGLIDEYEVPAEKITVIPPGVNAPAWARPEPRRRHDGPVKILFVGGGLERKGGLLLLDAFRRLRQKQETADLELHLVTKDTVPAEPGVFVYNDLQPNSVALKQLYHDSDLFCLPTYGDCLPMVLSEAAAAGLTAVSTRVAAIPEIIHDGKTGRLIPAGDADALTAVLAQLIANPDLRLQQGERARQLVRQMFDAQTNAARLLALLKQTAAAGRNRHE